MLRFRRYRVFLIFAAVATLLIIRFTNSRNIISHLQTQSFEAPPSSPKKNDQVTAKTTPPAVLKDKLQEPAHSHYAQLRSSSTSAFISTSSQIKIADQPTEIPTNPQSPPSIPKVVLPDRVPLPPSKVSDDEYGNDIHPVAPPGRQDAPIFSAAPTTIHWEKQVENFAVPTASIVKLPTGQPLKIPKIQYSFSDETTDAKITRDKRQARVKDEFKRAWNGYKQKAWLHDELSPVSGKFRDPFCGWAATLVDTLDTLWIMGLQEEFEEATRAVDLIDFTTSPRADIPMFETTIRYLGGLLAAYDVSEGKYKSLLNKATELGEVLMGAFDTPNRMPVLYYHWKPTFASQPHRASQRSSLAELGSLSMEFTRLSQLTQNPKYYDAIARITDALAEWQERGTRLYGVFPDNVDASGCNRTQPAKEESLSAEPGISPAHNLDEPVGFRPETPATVAEPIPKKNKGKTSGPGTLEVEVMDGEPGKARIIGWEDEPKKKEGLKLAKRGSDGNVPTTNNSSNTPTPTTDSITGLPLDIPAAKKHIGDSLGDWDCHPQGLESASSWGAEKFSMGGGQDSTYEYFPKQYLLLGGLEGKYREMYLKTIDAVKKWMVYRPMIPDNRDILFSGSVMASAGESAGEPRLSADVEHLTCFIGGMVGLGAQVFGLEGDLELAKKLADGCVWAYESTMSGIMPEGATVMPCKSAEHCIWNETEYMQFLDPQWAMRDQQVIDYEQQKALRLEREKAEKIENERLAAEEKALQEEKQHDPTVSDFMHDHSTHDLDSTNSAENSEILKKETPVSLQKRQMGPPKDSSSYSSDDLLESTSEEPIAHSVKLTPQEQSYADRVHDTEAELADISQSGRLVEKPLVAHENQELPPDPLRPLNHSEYVAARIRQESLPPGFVTISSRKYILRPEAIESVWYMYRITGDTTWQEKGWKMFESIIEATSTKYGHSAILDVTVETPTQVDEMESFWLAETLKYFYLLYSTPDTISLDDWVLNTEAHPFRRPK